MPQRILVVDDSATIRRVVGAILERSGYEVSLAQDGQAALDVLTGEKKVPVDLVLLDFVMPKMNGYQFCRAVRQNDAFAALPVVLMSAKSDKIRDQFVQQTGAIDAISKPFDAQALVAVIEHALRRVETGRASAVRLPELEEEEPPDSSRTTSPGDERMRRARIAAEVGVRFARTIAPALVGVHAAGGDEETFVRELTDKLDEETLRSFAAAVRDLDVDDSPKPALSGDLAIIPIGAILQMLQVEGQSGVLSVGNRASEITITLRGGLIDLVQSRGTIDEFRLGRYFVEEGLVTPDELDRMLVKDAPANDGVPPMSGKYQTAPPPIAPSPDTSPEGLASARSPADAEPPTMRLAPGEAEELIKQAEAEAMSGKVAPTSPDGVPAAMPKLLGDRLLAAGRVNEEQLRAALVRQSSELVYEMLRWQKGRFEFKRRPAPALAAAAKLGLTVPAVVMEGFRRVDEWRGLEGTIGDFEGVVVQDTLALATLPAEKLARPERAVLDAIDGERTIREVIAASHMSSFDACRVLVQLLEARLVRRKNI